MFFLCDIRVAKGYYVFLFAYCKDNTIEAFFPESRLMDVNS